MKVQKEVEEEEEEEAEEEEELSGFAVPSRMCCGGFIVTLGVCRRVRASWPCSSSACLLR